MPDVWRIYRIKNCCHTTPRKDKFAIIACHDTECMGFLVNSEINPFVIKKPYLLKCQVPLKKDEYRFLFHDSYLDCARLYPFNDDELNIGLEIASNETIKQIKIAVSIAKTIEKRFVKLILDG